LPLKLSCDFPAKILRAELIKGWNFNFVTSAEVNKKTCEFLVLLMNDQVTSVSFSQMQNLNKEGLKSVIDSWFAMTNKCPKLKTLVCEAEHLFPRETDESKQLVFLGCLLHFSELQVLQMPNMECDNFRLGLLADNLPQLRYLNSK